jgi:membrane-associated protease RseP (regulator of RpoE activity)
MTATMTATVTATMTATRTETRTATTTARREMTGTAGRTTKMAAAMAWALVAACATSAQAAPPDSGTAARPRLIKLDNPFVLMDGDGDGFMIARRGHLGLQLLALTPELREHFGAPKDAGVLVARVTADGPAAKAGVKVGDIVTSVDGEKVGDDSDLRRRVRGKADKDTVTLEILRNRAKQTLKAQIERKETTELDLGDLMWKGNPKLHFDSKRLNDAVNQAMRNFDGSEFRQQVERRRDAEEKLQQRTRALEERIERLEKQLQGKK